MTRKREPHQRKLRTREHVIADLSINHVEGQILLRGFSVNRMATDYGIDMMMLTYTDEGEVENGHVLFQVKATDALQVLKDQQNIALRVEVADLKLWEDELMPVILVIYDGKVGRAYWLYVQQYLEQRNVSVEDLAPDQDRVTVRIPLRNRLNRKAIDQIRQFRDQHMNLPKGGAAREE